MNLQTTRLIYDDPEIRWTKADLNFVDRAWFLYRALFQQERAIQRPEDFDGPTIDEPRDLFTPREIF